MQKHIKKQKGIKRLALAMKNSWNGLKVICETEEAFIQEIVLAIILVPLMFLVETTTMEKLLLTLSLFILFIVEIINSAIEVTIDRIGLEYNELSGKAKDVGSAAVLLSIILLVIVWGGIILPKLL